MRKIGLALLLALTLFGSCKTTQKAPEISFYYWKTIFKLTQTEQRILAQNKVKNLYVRYCDIDISSLNQKPSPLNPIKFEHKTDGFKIIPVIYIKNRVMLQKDLDLKDLAYKTVDFIQQINKSQSIQSTEIQIDCDWTLKSRDNYLKFLEHLKAISRLQLSATIRLHQVKYFLTTKIPNVEYGVLMYYNMGHISSDSTNSIYDKAIANKYIQSLNKYPLELKVALPIFSWAIHSSNNKVMNLISKVNVGDFENDTNFITQAKNQFLVKNANIKLGYYFKQNDKVKFEAIGPEDLMEMANDLNDNIRNSPKEIIFYDLDSTNLKKYTNEDQLIKKIASCF